MAQLPQLPFEVKALYKYESDHPDDLSFDVEQRIVVDSIEGDEWLSGHYRNDPARQGMFPRNFVEVAESLATLKNSLGSTKDAPKNALKQSKDSTRAPSKGSADWSDQEEDSAQEEDDFEVKLSSPAAPAVTESISQPDVAVPASDPAQQASQLSPSYPTANKFSQMTISEEKVAPRSAFKDRIAAFNSQTAAPLKPQMSDFKNESFVKKPFIAAPSSYMPKPPPPTPGAKPAVKSPPPPPPAPVNESEEETEPVPKLSLKERIKMLQQQQQEEKERAEAVAQRKKQKAKSKREAAQETTQDETGDPRSTQITSPLFAPLRRSMSGNRELLEKDVTGESVASTEPLPPPRRSGSFDERRVSNEARSAISSIGEVPEPEILSTTVENYEQQQGQESKEEAEQQPQNEDDEEDEDEEDEEDEEEAKRIALRERMAKISGGMGMNLGMLMGGGIPTPSTKKKNKSRPKAKEQGQEELAYSPAPVPMFPFADPNALAALKRKNTEPSDQEEDNERDIEQEYHENEVVYNEETEQQPMSPSTTGGRAPPPPIPRSPNCTGSSHRAPPPLPPTVSPSTTGGSSHRQAPPMSPVAAPPPRPPPMSPSTTGGSMKRAPPPPVPTVSQPLRHTRDDSFSSDAIRDEVIEDELGDDEKTESEEPTRRPSIGSPPPPPPSASKRLSYVSGSGVVPPIPGQQQAPQVPQRSNTMDVTTKSPDSLRKSNTFASPTSPIVSRFQPFEVPGHVPAPPLPPVRPEEESQGTGYEADDSDTEVSHGSFALPAAAPPLPPLSSRPPPPPVPVGHEVEEVEDVGEESGYEDYEDNRDDDDGSYAPSENRSETPQAPALPPPPPSSLPPAPSAHAPFTGPTSIPPHFPVPSPPLVSASKSTTAAAPGQRRRSSGSAVRMSLDGSRGRISIDNNSYIAQDILLDDDSMWWTQPNAPPTRIQDRVNKDLIYEVEDNQSTKRGGRVTVTRDVYILYRDYSQTNITVRYEQVDPRHTVTFEQSHVAPPSWRQDQLEGAYNRFGRSVLELASRSLNQTLPAGDFVPGVLRQIQGALPSIGRRAHGALIYDNLANATVRQYDEIRAGDVVTFRNTKFQGHKGGLHQKYSQEAGRADLIHLGIVYEWDGTKKKVRVYEQQADSKGKVKQESYKLSDLKSGEVSVYRVVGRDYVGWDQ